MDAAPNFGVSMYPKGLYKVKGVVCNHFKNMGFAGDCCDKTISVKQLYPLLYNIPSS